MKKALTAVIVSIVMVTSSVSAISADTASSGSTPVAQTGPLSPGGPVVVSPAQDTNDIFVTVCPNGDCTPLFVGLGIIGMGVGLAAIMGAFNNNRTATTVSTGTGG